MKFICSFDVVPYRCILDIVTLDSLPKLGKQMACDVIVACLYVVIGEAGILVKPNLLGPPKEMICLGLVSTLLFTSICQMFLSCNMSSIMCEIKAALDQVGLRPANLG